MMNEATLPSGWEIAALENVCELVAGNPAPQGHQFFENGKFSFVRVQDMGRMGNSTFLSETKDKINEQAISKLRLFPKGSVLFTKSGASTLNNQRAILGKDCYVVSHIAAALPQAGILSEWIYFSLVCVDFADLAHSSVMPSLPLSKVKSIPVVIPPTNEQHRIVAKIEELFSELDKGIESLKTARAQLKVYRQALLKHAFEGKLTAQWRAENKDKIETADALLKRIQQERAQRYQQQLADWQTNGGSKPKAPKSLPPLAAEELAELPELPEGWGWVKLGDLASQITDGEHFKPPVKAEGVYFLSAKDVKHDGVSFDDPLFIDEETAEKARSRCAPERNDILIVSRGATVGRMCIVNTDERFCLLGSVILLKATAVVQSRYFLSALKSPLVNKKIVGVSGATAQQAIYLRDIQHVPVPVCSSLEQSKIVEELESKLSEVDQLELTITTALQQAEALRQSILKKAFSGQLVPQDPHDEPASKLLARIRAERAGVAAKPRKNISPKVAHAPD